MSDSGGNSLITLVPRGPGKYPAVGDKPRTQFLDRLIHLDTDHQSAPAHLLYSGNITKFPEQIITHLGGIGDQILVAEYVEHGYGRRTCQMISAESGAELSVDRLEIGAYEHSRPSENRWLYP